MSWSRVYLHDYSYTKNYFWLCMFCLFNFSLQLTLTFEPEAVNVVWPYCGHHTDESTKGQLKNFFHICLVSIPFLQWFVTHPDTSNTHGY